MKRLTTITRGVVYLMGAAVVSIGAILLPELAREEAVGKINPPPAYPYLISAWILFIPIFIALQQTLKLLNLIDRNRAFSNQTVKILQNIKYCSIIFGSLIVLGAIIVIILGRIANPTEDVTPVIALGFIFTFIASIMATFIAVLQKLFLQAIKIKSENDLIV